MIKESITIQDVIDLLNDALDKDSAAINAMFNHHFTCTHELANHSTIQANSNNQVTALGIINGIFGTRNDGSEAVVAIYEGRRIVRFAERRESG